MDAPMPPPDEAAFASLARVQRAFAAHLRDPDAVPAPSDVAPRRMQVYRELVHANVESLLATSFPVLRSRLADESWHALVRDFLARHVAKTPLFTRLALEFIAFLEGDRLRPAAEPPFAVELARWEWLETELLRSDEEPDGRGVDRDGDLLEGVPVVSPLARWLRAAWPVHRLRADDAAPARPEAPPLERPARETCLALCRGEDDAVRFMELTPLTLTLLERLAASPTRSGRDQLERLARELGRPDRERFVAQGLGVLEALRARGVLLGTRRASPTSPCRAGERS